MKFKKLLLIIFGIIFPLLILETGLRFAAWIAQSHLNKETFSNGGKLRILCLGDSYTYGLGVERDETFPAQLKVLLEKKLGNDKIEVINAGMPGMNTPLLANNFNAMLDTYKPNVVLVLIGTNDEWNFSGFLSEPRTPIDKFYSFIFSFRITRMFKIVKTAFKEKSEMSFLGIEANKEKISKMLRLIEESGGLNNSYYYQAVMLGNQYRDMDKFEEAKLYYDCAMKINSDDKFLAEELSIYYKRAITILRGELKKEALEKSKSKITNFIGSVYLNKEQLEPDNKFEMEMVDLSKICRTLSLYDDNLLLLTKTIYLYGFSQYIWEELDELFIAWAYPENAIEFYKTLAIKYSDNIDIYLRLVSQYKIVRDYNQVVVNFENILELNPDSYQAIEGITMANKFIDQGLSKDQDLSKSNTGLFAKINAVLDGGKSKIKTDDPVNDLVKAPEIALSVYIQEKRYDKQVEQILSQDKIYQELFGKDCSNQNTFVNQRLMKINNIVSQRIKQMCDAAKQRKLKILFLSYPLSIYQRVVKTVEDENIPFIDFRQSFVCRINSNNYKDYFLADGHCTEKGYKIMADKIFEIISPEILSQTKAGRNQN